MSEPTSSPPDLSGLQRASFEEIAPYLDKLSAQPDPRTERALNGLLLGRALRLLREGSRTELDEEALNLSRFLDSATGQAWRESRPEIHGGWCALVDLLAEAGRRSDPAAVSSILKSYEGHGRKLLELLAEHGAAVPRAAVKAHLELSESHLSHLLRDLEEADLIVRRRMPKSREVIVELGPVGRRTVEARVLPRWVEYLIERLSELAEPPVPEWDHETIRQGLVDHGSPSTLAAARLADALARLLPVRSTAESSPMDTSDADDVRLARANQDRVVTLFWPRAA